MSVVFSFALFEIAHSLNLDQQQQLKDSVVSKMATLCAVGAVAARASGIVIKRNFAAAVVAGRNASTSNSKVSSEA